MKHIFLGRPWHWALVLIVIALSWAAGNARLHVINFNSFLIALGIGTVVVLAVILAAAKPDQRLTRDPLEDIVPDPNEKGPAQ